jgi:glutathione peroxidase
LIGHTELNYAQLSRLHDEYYAHGLRILAFPCNQFGWQESGTKEDIAKFAASRSVGFRMMEKTRVNGGRAHPVFDFLTAGRTQPIAWNFTKFVINRSATEFRRFSGEPRMLEPLVREFLGLQPKEAA